MMPPVQTKRAVRELPPPRGVVERVVTLAIEEDLGRGDVTTEACVPAGVRGEAVVRARNDLVLSGLDLIHEVYRQVDPDVEVHDRARDAERIAAGGEIAQIVGRAQSILGGERVALNFAQRMSGIATLTRKYVDELPEGSTTRIVDTRKTTPGLRALERYAVRCGGAHNHREDLSSAVLIKDNHIAAAGGVAAAVERARRHAPHTSRIECEVESKEQLEEALAAGAEIVLLDNFPDEVLRQLVAVVKGRALVEVSGGVRLERVAGIAAAGVDIISVGALTHSAPSADIALDWSFQS
jgi:nicotinate-nucleotide pyrophosphorylase (carboxylating)